MIVVLTVLGIVLALLFLAYVERIDGPEIDANEDDWDWHTQAEALADREGVERADLKRFTEVD